MAETDRVIIPTPSLLGDRFIPAYPLSSFLQGLFGDPFMERFAREQHRLKALVRLASDEILLALDIPNPLETNPSVLTHTFITANQFPFFSDKPLPAALTYYTSGGRWNPIFVPPRIALACDFNNFNDERFYPLSIFDGRIRLFCPYDDNGIPPEKITLYRKINYGCIRREIMGYRNCCIFENYSLQPDPLNFREELYGIYERINHGTALPTSSDYTKYIQGL